MAGLTTFLILWVLFLIYFVALLPLRYGDTLTGATKSVMRRRKSQNTLFTSMVLGRGYRCGVQRFPASSVLGFPLHVIVTGAQHDLGLDADKDFNYTRTKANRCISGSMSWIGLGY